MYEEVVEIVKEDGVLSKEEKAQMKSIKHKMLACKEAYTTAVKEYKKNEEEEDPIVKRIDYELLIYLETFITVKYWELDKVDIKGYKPTTLPKVELDNEDEIPVLDIPANSKVEVYTWAKAIFKDANLFEADYNEIIQKDFFADVVVDKKGNFSLEDTNEKVGSNNSNLLKKYDISLNIDYVGGGKKIRLHADGFATAKVQEESYKNWDTKTKTEKREFKDQVLKSITPAFKLKAGKYIAPPSPSKELIFESENQAILSSDQRKVCVYWWEQLKPELKERIRNKKAKIVVKGFASPPGSIEYNEKLAMKRAQNIAKILSNKIGVDLDGKPIGIFNIISKGEETDDPKRYVKIIVVSL